MSVLDEVGKKWDSLTDIDQSAIATALKNKQGHNSIMHKLL